jgi:cystathionine beta-synthase
VLDEGRQVGAVTEGALMTKALGQPALLDRPVRELMEAPFPEVDETTALDRLAPVLSHESAAALVTRDGMLVGIVSRYDLMREMIGTR